LRTATIFVPSVSMLMTATMLPSARRMMSAGQPLIGAGADERPQPRPEQRRRRHEVEQHAGDDLDDAPDVRVRHAVDDGGEVADAGHARVAEIAERRQQIVGGEQPHEEAQLRRQPRPAQRDHRQSHDHVEHCAAGGDEARLLHGRSAVGVL
jgi:hypothetical protein